MPLPFAVSAQFRAADGALPIATYWLESTAPLSVDEKQLDQMTTPGTVAAPKTTPDALPGVRNAQGKLESEVAQVIPPAKAEEKGSETRDAMRAIVSELVKAHRSGQVPRLVITVHGFNNPFNVVCGRYETAARAVNSDPNIRAEREGMVCVGYRWPSEKSPLPFRGCWGAMPSFLLFICGLALGLMALAVPLFWAATVHSSRFLNFTSGATTLLSLLVMGLPLAAVGLRSVGYYRDLYRAQHYAVPDLVEFLRYLHRDLEAAPGSEGMQVDVSFIGHSMGAFVVTNTVRVLSDAFDPNSIGSLDPDAIAKRPGHQIGKMFCLAQLVLVSPDIPAEALMMRRANFLASSLRRFRESYLFSNEADVVLRLISTLANYFSFPTKDRANGFRLGNIEVLGEDPDQVTPGDFGIVNLQTLRNWRIAGLLTPVQLEAFLNRLRVGQKTLQGLNCDYNFKPGDTQLPALFTYFDCTDYRDDKDGRAEVPYLSFGQGKAKLSGWDNLRLLVAYARAKPAKVDVHSGYFDGPLTRTLIYQLACLGFEKTCRAQGGLDRLDERCARHGLQVLLSPERMLIKPVVVPPHMAMANGLRAMDARKMTQPEAAPEVAPEAAPEMFGTRAS